MGEFMVSLKHTSFKGTETEAAQVSKQPMDEFFQFSWRNGLPEPAVRQTGT